MLPNKETIEMLGNQIVKFLEHVMSNIFWSYGEVAMGNDLRLHGGIIKYSSVHTIIR